MAHEHSTSTFGFRPTILSRASEAGSPKNHLGPGQRRDTDQWPFSPSSLYRLTNRLIFLKKLWANTRPVLLRQGEPGTPQYIELYSVVTLGVLPKDDPSCGPSLSFFMAMTNMFQGGAAQFLAMTYRDFCRVFVTEFCLLLPLVYLNVQKSTCGIHN